MGGAQDSIPVRLGRGEPVDVVIVIEAHSSRSSRPVISFPAAASNWRGR
jgi:hypothetical protein